MCGTAHEMGRSKHGVRSTASVHVLTKAGKDAAKCSGGDISLNRQMTSGLDPRWVGTVLVEVLTIGAVGTVLRS
jgi:hypothetical protein